MSIVLHITRTIKKHERMLVPAALLLGFIVDYLTLNRVDQLFDNIVLFFYVSLAAIALSILYGPLASSRLATVAPLAFQYAIGGLFSGLFIFYFRSGILSVSFPFLVILLVLMLGSDYFYKRFPRASFQLVIFFIALLSYANLLAPLITKQIGILTFLGATIIAAALMYVFTATLGIQRNKFPHVERKKIERRLAITALVFVGMYLTNIIPPLPLSMKAGVIGYNVLKQGSEYQITIEQAPWYMPLSSYKNDVHTSGPVFAFSAIFAPTDLKTQIMHVWQYHDQEKGWVTVSRIPISIIGGREQGFRGYSTKETLTPGRWRVDVTTARGQVVGRLPFTVTPGTPQHKEVITY